MGRASYHDPYTGIRQELELLGGGRGYTRPPSLISLWSTAPYLLNNRVGDFNPDPSIAGRMASFDSSIRQLLWPERRAMDPVFGNRVLGLIDRTQTRSYVFIPKSYLPKMGPVTKGYLRRELGKDRFDGDGNLMVGPIPKGMPIGALTNLRLRAEEAGEDKGAQLKKVVGFGKQMIGILRGLRQQPAASEADYLARFAALRPSLRELSKCPDFVVNRGHYFGTGQFGNRAGLTADEAAWIGNEAPLGDPDKEALIAYLKTF